MAASLVPPSVESEPERTLSDIDEHRSGGGPGGPSDDQRRVIEREPEPTAPLGAYRLVAIVAMVWIAALFGTLAIVLESRWAHAADWIRIPLPRIPYVTTAILVMSSIAVELARRALHSGHAARFGRWILATLWLGFTFLVGQGFAWRELAIRGMHLASNPGSFLFYLITGIHGVFLAGGMALLASVGLFAGRSARSEKQKTAIGSISLYWQFLVGLWLCVFALLLATLER